MALTFVEMAVTFAKTAFFVKGYMPGLFGHKASLNCIFDYLL